MSGDFFVGMGAPLVSTFVVDRGNVRVKVSGSPGSPDLTEVTSATWEVLGPNGKQSWPTTILTQSSTQLELMREHQASDFPVEGNYEVRARLVLPTGVLISDWRTLRVTK